MFAAKSIQKVLRQQEFEGKAESQPNQKMTFSIGVASFPSDAVFKDGLLKPLMQHFIGQRSLAEIQYASVVFATLIYINPGTTKVPAKALNGSHCGFSVQPQADPPGRTILLKNSRSGESQRRPDKLE